MLKRTSLILLISLVCIRLHAAIDLSKNPNFTNILKLKDKGELDHQLVRYILNFYISKPLDSLDAGKAQMKTLFAQYNLENREAFEYFVDFSLYQRRLQTERAEDALVKAIRLATKVQDHSLLYPFYSELGFLQTYMGNTSEAVYSFRMAKMQATILDNSTFIVMVDINLSDILYRNNLYRQSLSHLEHAQHIIAERAVKEARLINIIYNNAAENYFRMNNLDSLKRYNALLHGLKDGVYKKHIFTKRSDYYIQLLQHNYQAAISSIIALKKDSLYLYENNDEQNLAYAYYNAGMLDSSKSVINRLLADRSENNHPEIKYHQYKILGQIAEKQHDVKAATYNYKMGLLQAEEQINRLTQVDNIASQIKIDDAQGSFDKKEESYKNERQGLIYVLIISMLTVAVIAMIFNATRRKRYYDRLVFNSKRKELSIINSHEVRRHLSNILGLIDVIRTSENKHQQYLEAEDHILRSAEQLDGAIQTISEKLDHDEDVW